MCKTETKGSFGEVLHLLCAREVLQAMQEKQGNDLVKRAKRRETDAFTQLMQLHMKDMYRTAVSILMNDEDAADAIQDAILACWEKIDGLKEPRYFRTWMTRILINKCYDIRRRNQRFTSFEDCEEPAAEDHYNLEWKEALSALDERHRTVIELFYGQGCRTEEIAKILGIPKSTVQTRLWRGRKKLEGYYAEEYRRCEGTS